LKYQIKVKLLTAKKRRSSIVAYVLDEGSEYRVNEMKVSKVEHGRVYGIIRNDFRRIFLFPVYKMTKANKFLLDRIVIKHHQAFELIKAAIKLEKRLVEYSQAEIEKDLEKGV